MNKPFLFNPSCTKSSTELPQTSASPMVTFTEWELLPLGFPFPLLCSIYFMPSHLCEFSNSEPHMCPLAWFMYQHSPSLSWKGWDAEPKFCKSTMSCQLPNNQKHFSTVKINQTSQGLSIPTRKDAGSSQYAASPLLPCRHMKKQGQTTIPVRLQS